MGADPGPARERTGSRKRRRSGQYIDPGAAAPQDHSQGALARGTVAIGVPMLFTTRMPVIRQPIGTAARIASGVTSSAWTKHVPTTAMEPKKNEHGPSPGRNSRTGQRPDGVGDGREDRRHADDQDRPAAQVDQVEASQCGQSEHNAHASLHLARCEQSRRRDASRSHPSTPIGPSVKIPQVIGEIRADLDHQPRRRARP